MNDETLVRELRRISCLDDLRCLGCGYEYRCSIHGCAIINQAVERLEALTKPQPNEPLTLSQLKEMDGEPVWIEFSNCREADGWALVDTARLAVDHACVGLCSLSELFVRWRAFARKPESPNA